MATFKNSTVAGTDAIQLPVGTTAQRPGSPTTGQIRYNSTFKVVETYDGTRWKYMPDIVRDGLVLNLDAGEPSSYPGSGTTWTDLSGSAITGTLTNGPTYSSSNGGFINFDGTDDMVIMANSTELDTQTPSVEVWVKTNATTQNGFWFEKGIVNTQYSLFQEGTNIQWRQYYSNLTNYTNLTTATATYMNTTSWYQVVGTYSSGNRRLYINGVLVNSDAQTGTLATNSGGMSIGVFGGFSGSRGYYYNGSLAICRIYRKSLSEQEVNRNYLATKARFGL